MSFSLVDRSVKTLEFIKGVLEEKDIIKSPYYALATVGVALGWNALYASFTTIKNIVVKSKYTMFLVNKTLFMVIGDDGVNYEISSSLLYWQWNVPEIWHTIVPNQKYTIKFYGWRVPFLGLYPQVVKIDE
jgi:hypothetical protein